MKTFLRFLSLFASSAPTRDAPFTSDLETVERLTPNWPRPQQQWLIYGAPEFPAKEPEEYERVDVGRDEAP